MIRYGSDEVVNSGDAEKVSGKRPGERATLKYDQVGVELTAAGKHVINHVGSRDFSKQSGQKVVIDPAGGEPVAGNSPNPALELFEPHDFPVARRPERGSGCLHQGRGIGRGGHDHLIAPSEERLD